MHAPRSSLPQGPHGFFVERDDVASIRVRRSIAGVGLTLSGPDGPSRIKVRGTSRREMIDGLSFNGWVVE